MKLTKNFGIATFALAISLATFEAKATQAAVVNYNFAVNATSGSNPGQYFGSFGYDDSNLNRIGEENLDVNNGLLFITFDYLGTTYTEIDDIEYSIGGGPLVSFRDGELLGLSYLVENQFFIGGDLDTPFTGGNRFYTTTDFLSAEEVGTVSYSTVPEPLALFGTAIATVTGFLVNRQKKNNQMSA
ncbi:PEP-CTERM sorting domain-containing protein [Anabaena subtropica]|uniref:PEP-CTERM sorting domain-containing protein n=1 Tax=Anabaena subtropica FACHB-260 TaxID=2692884 RepID=A0ABR8CUZ9_9NOST|nr:PEP-CTERM sorting domain-containing protein [Anabaena subtropica]MBD2346188.1 PEP-CTERM sorting domain-containing protein [Anabaena subtropica FACHB-260]